MRHGVLRPFPSRGSHTATVLHVRQTAAPGRSHHRAWRQRDMRWNLKYVEPFLDNPTTGEPASRSTRVPPKGAGGGFLPPGRPAVSSPTPLVSKCRALSGGKPLNPLPPRICACSAHSASTPSGCRLAGPDRLFMRRVMTQRRKRWGGVNGPTGRAERPPMLQWHTSRKCHNKTMHALNGNTAPSAVPLTAAQLELIAERKQQVVERRRMQRHDTLHAASPHEPLAQASVAVSTPSNPIGPLAMQPVCGSPSRRVLSAADLEVIAVNRRTAEERKRQRQRGAGEGLVPPPRPAGYVAPEQPMLPDDFLVAPIPQVAPAESRCHHNTLRATVFIRLVGMRSKSQASRRGSVYIAYTIRPAVRP